MGFTVLADILLAVVCSFLVFVETMFTFNEMLEYCFWASYLVSALVILLAISSTDTVMAETNFVVVVVKFAVQGNWKLFRNIVSGLVIKHNIEDV